MSETTNKLDDLGTILKNKEEDLKEVKEKMKTIDDNTANLRAQRDKLLTRGIELQGAIGAVREILALKSAEQAINSSK